VYADLAAALRVTAAVSATGGYSLFSAHADLLDSSLIAAGGRRGPPVALEPRVARGFSLLEVLVASAVLSVAVVGVAPLLTLSSSANRNARATTTAAILAQQKIEQLRTLAWSVDADGSAISDTTTDITTTPERADAGVGLSPSPPGALDRNTPGYFDIVDSSGQLLAGDQPSAHAFIRRWSVDPLPADAVNTLVLRVRVVRAAAPGASGRVPDEARVTTVKTRRAS
jgi:prepilin-type N-terminal cleavage/methylation domain-containing protein